jgi:hypothetical protein
MLTAAPRHDPGTNRRSHHTAVANITSIELVRVIRFRRTGTHRPKLRRHGSAAPKRLG